MVRADLIKSLAVQHSDLKARDIEAIVTAFFDAITTSLAEGGRVEIRGFGAFTTRARDARTGRNPRSGELVDVAAKRVPHFKPGKELRERIDEASVQV
jgi:integration host factor subunit beta